MANGPTLRGGAAASAGVAGASVDMSSRSSAGERSGTGPGAVFEERRDRGPGRPGTRVPIAPGEGDRSRARRQTGSVSALRTWLGDPYLVRRVTYGAAGGAVVVSMLAAVGEGTTSYAVSAVVPVVVVLSLPSRRWRATVLAAGALFVAAWTFGDSTSLWLAVAALVFGSVAEDQRTAPWVGWAGGLLGSVLSLVLSAEPNLAPFVATLVGGGAGLLLRSRLRTIELAQETEGAARPDRVVRATHERRA